MSSAGDLHRAWRNLPVADLDTVIGLGTCLILAPHPDDESLGCGGLIASCVAAGRTPLVVVLTDGAGSHPNSRTFPPDRLRAERANEVRTAVGHLGLPPDRVVFLGEPDTAAPHEGPGFERVVAALADFVTMEANCTAIVAPWLDDPHCDHRAASLAAAAAADVTGCRHVAYPVWGWTLPATCSIPGSPDVGWRLDIGVWRSAKRAAIMAHRSQ